MTASGAGPLVYVWYLNGQPLSAPSSPTFVLTNIQMSQTGSYMVFILNGTGTAYSSPAFLNVMPLPVITQQPLGTYVLQGATATLRVSAAGTGALNYQWQLNGTALTGATNSVLTRTNLQPDQAGNYRVLVTDTVGTRASQTAAVSVLQKPVIVTQPASATVPLGAPVSLTVAVSGTDPLWYRWRKNGATYLWPGAASLILPGAVLTNAGIYEVAVTNLATTLFGGAVLSAKSYLVVVAPPTNQLLTPGSDATLRAIVSAPPGITNRFQWRLGETLLQDGTNVSTSVSPQFTNDLVLTNIGPAQAGSYTFDLSYPLVVTNMFVTTNPPATNYVVATNYISAPASFVALVQLDSDGDGIPDDWMQQYFGHATAKPEDFSRPSDDPDGDSLSNWQEYIAGTVPTDARSKLNVETMGQTLGSNWVAFAATSNRTYSLQFRESFQAGSWTTIADQPATASNRFQTLADPYPLTRGRLYRIVTPSQPRPANAGPIILESPQPSNPLLGDSVDFAVVAVGDGPLAYQWLFNQTNSLFPSQANLLLTNIQPPSSGRYSVIVSDQHGSAMAGPALLLVRPVILSQPQDQTVKVGESVSLQTSASGLDPLRFQWRRDGRRLAGQTNAVITIEHAETADGGIYSVLVSHTTPAGVATTLSRGARLTVLP